MSGYDHGHHGHSNESAVYDEKYSKEYTKNYNMERGIDYDLEAVSAPGRCCSMLLC